MIFIKKRIGSKKGSLSPVSLTQKIGRGRQIMANGEKEGRKNEVKVSKRKKEKWEEMGRCG